MSNFKFKLNKKGVGKLLHSNEVKNMLSVYGQSVVSKCGNGYESEVVKSSDRLKVFVNAKTKKAKRDNNKNNTLLKALR